MTDAELQEIQNQWDTVVSMQKGRSGGRAAQTLIGSNVVPNLIATIRAERSKLGLVCELFGTYASHDPDCVCLISEQVCDCGLAGALIVVSRATTEAPTASEGVGEGEGNNVR